MRGGKISRPGPTLSSGAPHERGEEELERKHHGSAARSPAPRRSTKSTRPRQTGQSAPRGFSEKGTQKAETSEVPDMGLEQKGKTVEAKRSSRYGARTHDFFACGGPAHTLTAQQRRSKLSRACPSCRLLPGVRVPNDLAGADARLPHLADGGSPGGGGSVLTKINMKR